MKRSIHLNIIFGICLLLFMSLLTSCDAGYKNDGSKVTYHWWNEGSGHGSRVIDADPATFEDLGDDYARDAYHAFHEGNIIKGADGATFKYLGNCYAVDAHHVFCYDTIMSTADPKTFKVHSYYFTEDAKDYYWCGHALHVADKKSFIILGDVNDNLETNWAKDKRNAYYLGCSNPVALADYESFHPIEHKPAVTSGAYAADKYNVYFMDHVVEGADPKTFHEVDFWVGQDKYRTYYEWHPTKVKDYRRLKSIGAMFTDGKHIYDNDLMEFEGADVATFKHLDGNWYVDKQHVWWQSRLVKDADVHTFAPVYSSSFNSGRKEVGSVDFNYGKDAYHVFFRDSIMVGVDPKTFEKIDFRNGESWTVFDKNHIYEGANSRELKEYLKSKR